MKSKAQFEKTFTIIDIAGDIECAITEQLILDRLSYIDAVKIDWMKGEITLWSDKKEITIENLNKALNEYKIIVSDEKPTGPNGLLSFSPEGFLKFKKKGLKGWISIIGVTIGLIALVSAFADYLYTLTKVDWGFLNLLYIPKGENFLTYLLMVFIGIVVGKALYFWGVEKLLTIDYTVENRKYHYKTAIGGNLLNRLGHTVASILTLFILTVSVEILTSRFTLFLLIILLIATSITQIGLWRRKNPIFHFNFTISSMIRDITSQSLLLKEFVKGVLSSLRIDPLFILIWSAIFINANVINSIIFILLLEVGILISTMTFSLMQQRWLSALQIRSTYPYKVFSTLMLLIGVVLLNDFFKFYWMPNLFEIESIKDVWSIFVLIAIIFLVARELSKSVWSLLFKPLTIKGIVAIFSITIYLGLLYEILKFGVNL